MVTLVRWGSHHILLLDDLGAVYYPGPLEPTRGLRLVDGCIAYVLDIEMFFVGVEERKNRERKREREKSSMERFKRGEGGSI